MTEPEPALCPSSRCKSGNVLLGVVEADGRVGFFGERIVLDEEFVRIAESGRSPEKRFRFSSPCARAACRQWKGDHCGVIEALVQNFESKEVAAELPNCSIRPQCRWFREHGRTACGVCPLVVTDAYVPETEVSGDLKSLLISDALQPAIS